MARACSGRGPRRVIRPGGEARRGKAGQGVSAGFLKEHGGSFGLFRLDVSCQGLEQLGEAVGGKVVLRGRQPRAVDFQLYGGDVPLRGEFGDRVAVARAREVVGDVPDALPLQRFRQPRGGGFVPHEGLAEHGAHVHVVGVIGVAAVDVEHQHGLALVDELVQGSLEVVVVVIVRVGRAGIGGVKDSRPD